MKDINEMTDQEILSLTNEDIERMIKIKAMERGIKLVGMPIEPHLITVDDPQTIAYEIPVIRGFFFRNKEEVEKVSNFLKQLCSLMEVEKDWGFCDFYHTLNNKDRSLNDYAFDVKTVNIYLNEEYEVVSDRIRRNNKLRDAYIKELSEYNKYLQSISDIDKSIRGKAEEVRSKYAKLERLSYKFAIEYISVTQGDEDMAMKFFEMAYDISDDDKSFIRTNYHKYLTGERDDTEADENGGASDTKAAPLPHE